MTLEILFQDDRFVAINKPSGLLVHRSNIDRQETRFAVQMLRDQLGQHVYPVHRLDKPTSGVLLFALDRDAAQVAGTLFSEQRVGKEYLAVVRGHTCPSGEIDYPLRPQHDPYDSSSADAQAQQAVTRYTRLAQAELSVPVGRYSTARYSLLLLNPETGRKHQLRRHLKHIFHPIVGDTSHGDGKHNKMFREHLGIRQLLLSSVQLTFHHPYSGKLLSIDAPVGKEFERAACELGWDLRKTR